MGYKEENIKVDRKIKPQPVNKRTTVNFIVGRDYYVSYGCNEARRCRLIGVDPREIEPRIRIVMLDNHCEHHLWSDEIGETPEQAVINQVTM